jgi:hypothetical protein
MYRSDLVSLQRRRGSKFRCTVSFKPPIAARAEHPAVSSGEIQVNMQWMSKTPQIDPYWCS